jgi:hypothetical protein
MPSDSDILNLIEDFLFNNFGDIERQQLDDGEAVRMLEHISDLVDLRCHTTRGTARRPITGVAD